ncbi:hypothetical protein GCM10023322_79110 [Rugosimonospora acidiphila]|uniref:MarR family transcriptional regulator n=1 Tax=Rugosimonospora acidiphila TaxID=556531 RepID=A0ABP9SQA0_9ACTN
MTGKPTTTSDKPELAPGPEKVLAALHRLGEATAAATATEACLGYSTTTPKLRALETAGFAEPFRSEDGRTLWRLTDAGHTQAEQLTDLGRATAQPAVTDSPTVDAADTKDTTAADICENTSDGAARDDPEQPRSTDFPDTPVDVAAQSAEAATSPTSAENTHSAADDEHEDGPAASASPAADEPQPVAGDAAGTITVPSDSQAADAPTETRPDNEPAATADDRRAPGTLRGAILDILEANPNQCYKVSELCKLIDKANEATDARNASAGAVNNAAMKLVGLGRAVLAMEKPVTFALARDGA